MLPPPTLNFELELHAQGISLVAGIDEVGMGALAGPVVAAAVILCPPDQIELQDWHKDLRDSKQLSSKRREKVAANIQAHAYAWAIARASVNEITTHNIRAASHLAMRRAAEQLSYPPQLLLIDGTPAQPHPAIPAHNIIKGDSLSLSIAAASILAKVHRDYIMTELDLQYPVYKFASNKGYGAAVHLDALKEIGACPYHRPTYAPVAKALLQ